MKMLTVLVAYLFCLGLSIALMVWSFDTFTEEHGGIRSIIIKAGKEIKEISREIDK